MSVKLDTSKFDEAFKRYVAITNRDLHTATNTTAYYIARKAVWFTEKANKEQVKSSLVSVVTSQVTNRKGAVVTRRKKSLVKARDHDAPLAAVIINARRKRAGKKGLFGAQMKAAVREMIAARVRSVAYIKSGWIPAIRTLEGVADKGKQPRIDSSAKQLGKPKGYAVPARGLSWTPVAKIVNEAYAKRDKKDAFGKVGGGGLQMAIDDETASKNQYIEDKMKERAEEFKKS